LRIVVEDVRDLDDRVLVLGRAGGRGRASRIDVDAPIGIAYDFDRRKLSRVRAYLDHAEASKPWGWRSSRCRREGSGRAAAGHAVGHVTERSSEHLRAANIGVRA
jgi:hypothetical protein